MAKKSGLEFAADLARHAKAIYDIIKAAISGGWTGAALAALKHYWPQILAISFVGFILPVVIFVSLPALIFDAIFGGGEMTMQDMVYEKYSDYEYLIGSGIDVAMYDFYQAPDETVNGNTTRVYNEICAEFTGEVMDIYWYAAIHAVYLKNETPTREQIIDFSKYALIVSVTEVITNTVVTEHEPDSDTGETPPPDITIYIDKTLVMSHADPYTLMNILGFTEADIEWAEAMYSTMKELDGEGEIVLIEGISLSNPLPLNWRSAVTSEFGYRTDPVNGGADNHTGIDLEAPQGTDIKAVMDGIVTSVVYGESGYGYYVKIEHNNVDNSVNSIETMYCHCSEIYVSVDDEVKQGDVIAAIGETGKTTGPHLHLELRINGKAINPRPYLP